jgi:hypothetical protein
MELRGQGWASRRATAFAVMVALAVLQAACCVVVATAWSREREAKACWQGVAKLEIRPDNCER